MLPVYSGWPILKQHSSEVITDVQTCTRGLLIFQFVWNLVTDLDAAQHECRVRWERRAINPFVEYQCSKSLLLPTIFNVFPFRDVAHHTSCFSFTISTSFQGSRLNGNRLMDGRKHRSRGGNRKSNVNLGVGRRKLVGCRGMLFVAAWGERPQCRVFNDGSYGRKGRDRPLWHPLWQRVIESWT